MRLLKELRQEARKESRREEVAAIIKRNEEIKKQVTEVENRVKLAIQNNYPEIQIYVTFKETLKQIHQAGYKIEQRDGYPPPIYYLLIDNK